MRERIHECQKLTQAWGICSRQTGYFFPNLLFKGENGSKITN
jgi:hypothetical protein